MSACPHLVRSRKSGALRAALATTRPGRALDAGQTPRRAEGLSQLILSSYTTPANQLQLARRGAAALWEKTGRGGSTAPSRDLFSVRASVRYTLVQFSVVSSRIFPSAVAQRTCHGER